MLLAIPKAKVDVGEPRPNSGMIRKWPLCGLTVTALYRRVRIRYEIYFVTDDLKARSPHTRTLQSPKSSSRSVHPSCSRKSMTKIQEIICAYRNATLSIKCCGASKW